MKPKKKMIWKQICNITDHIVNTPIDETITFLQVYKHKYNNQELQIKKELDISADVCFILRVHRLETKIEFKNRCAYESVRLKLTQKDELNEYKRLKKKYGELK